MGSSQDFMEFIKDQIMGAGAITYKKMFGEYAVYCNSKVVALVCDDQLFVKPTDRGRALLDTVVEAPPYPRAKAHLLIQEQIEDSEFLTRLISITAEDVPDKKPNVKKRTKKHN